MDAHTDRDDSVLDRRRPQAGFKSWLVPAIVIIFLVVTISALVGDGETRQLVRAGRSTEPGIFNNLWRILVSMAMCLAAIAFLTMAIVEYFKGALRPGFQMKLLKTWLFSTDESGKAQIASFVNYKKFEPTSSDRAEGSSSLAVKVPRDPLEELAALSTAGHLKSLVSLPLERMCGQISTAAEQAIEEPREHIALLFHLLGRRNFTDEDEKAALKMVSAPASESSGTTGSPQVAPRDEEAYRARARFAHLIQRNIDHFQIEAGNEWGASLRNYAVVIAASIAAFGWFALAAGDSRLTLVHAALLILLLAILGGYTASLMRDLLVAITKVKR